MQLLRIYVLFSFIGTFRQFCFHRLLKEKIYWILLWGQWMHGSLILYFMVRGVCKVEQNCCWGKTALSCFLCTCTSFSTWRITAQSPALWCSLSVILCAIGNANGIVHNERKVPQSLLLVPYTGIFPFGTVLFNHSIVYSFSSDCYGYKLPALVHVCVCVLLSQMGMGHLVHSFPLPCKTSLPAILWPTSGHSL